MFKALSLHKKVIDGEKIQKIIVANNNDEYVNDFLNFKADKKITFAMNSKADYTADNIQETSEGVKFDVEKVIFKIGILGKFNVHNALPAIIICRLADISDYLIAKGLVELKTIPGRMERIDKGQNFTVLVDYAHEGKSMRAALSTVRKFIGNYGKVIVILGAEGGGRDKRKRPIMGKIAGELADLVIVSAIDPYDDDPVEINEEVALATEQVGKIRNKDLFVITDRREAIRKALSLARENDIVIITGKGSEQSMHIYGKIIPWDDREVVEEELKSFLPARA